MEFMSRGPRSLVVCLLSFVSFGFTSSPVVGGVDVGGSGNNLFVYDFEEFAEYAVGQGAAFVVLGNDTLGIAFGQMLVGQTQSAINGFDVITGSPSDPLTIDETTDASVGVNILPFAGTIIDGLGPVGFPDPGAIGDGAVTVVFDQDQYVVAFDVVGANGGAMELQFFGRAGQLLDVLTIDDVAPKTYTFGSDAGAIAGMTLTNTDPGGLGFDNFVFTPVGWDGAPTCVTGDAFSVSAMDDAPQVQLDAETWTGTEAASASYTWFSDCPGAVFSDVHAPQSTLSLVLDDPCGGSCSVSLLWDDGAGLSICSGSVVIEGEGGGAGLSCPPDTTVESDGAGNLTELTAWLDSVDGEAVVHDFSGVTPSCGDAGFATVTWVDTNAVAGGCGEASCSSTFTIVDTTGPVLDVGPSTIVVTNDTCASFVEVELADVLVDGKPVGEDGTVVSHDAPDLFPGGDTTTVTYTTSDACGNTSTATVSVTVEHHAGVDVEVVGRRDVEASRHTPLESLPGVTVFAFDASRRGCAHDASTRGLSHQDLAGVLSACAPVASGYTDGDGLVRIGLPEGQFVLVAPVDRDGDGNTDTLLGTVTGQIRCAHWKSRRLTDDGRTP